jgi:methionyl-tRNA synthetase
VALARGHPAPRDWPSTDARLELDRLPAGRPVAAPEVLFRKIEDDQIADWAQRYGGAEAPP